MLGAMSKQARDQLARMTPRLRAVVRVKDTRDALPNGIPRLRSWCIIATLDFSGCYLRRGSGSVQCSPTCPSRAMPSGLAALGWCWASAWH